jgi:hypothetical protein
MPKNVFFLSIFSRSGRVICWWLAIIVPHDSWPYLLSHNSECPPAFSRCSAGFLFATADPIESTVRYYEIYCVLLSVRMIFKAVPVVSKYCFLNVVRTFIQPSFNCKTTFKIILDIYILSRVWVTIDGFGLEIGFIDHLNTRPITTSHYSSIANLHALQITREHVQSFPACSVFTSRFLVTASNCRDFSASTLTLLLAGCGLAN